MCHYSELDRVRLQKLRCKLMRAPEESSGSLDRNNRMDPENVARFGCSLLLKGNHWFIGLNDWKDDCTVCSDMEHAVLLNCL